MPSDSTLSLFQLVQTHPVLSALRLAALTADAQGSLDDETLDLIFEGVENGDFRKLDPRLMWPELELGLMGQKPSKMLLSLHESGALHEILPEVAAVFGIPQIADDPPQVDIGLHMLRVLDQTAQCNAPIEVRFAALVMHVGKSDSPPEHLPVHYRHTERAQPRIESICARFGVPAECRNLALLALTECERVHRVSEVRAGPVAALLERIGAFDHPRRYQMLLDLCTCDYRAYRPHLDLQYPKARLLETALRACQSLPASTPDLVEARGKAIALALGSERWSN